MPRSSVGQATVVAAGASDSRAGAGLTSAVELDDSKQEIESGTGHYWNSVADGGCEAGDASTGDDDCVRRGWV